MIASDIWLNPVLVWKFDVTSLRMRVEQMEWGSSNRGKVDLSVECSFLAHSVVKRWIDKELEGRFDNREAWKNQETSIWNDTTGIVHQWWCGMVLQSFNACTFDERLPPVRQWCKYLLEANNIKFGEILLDEVIQSGIFVVWTKSVHWRWANEEINCQYSHFSTSWLYSLLSEGCFWTLIGNLISFWYQLIFHSF